MIKQMTAKHAAHCWYTGRPLHDLEIWEVEPGADCSAIPRDAGYAHGFMRDGVNVKVYTRTVKPSTDRCPHCRD